MIADGIERQLDALAKGLTRHLRHLSRVRLADTRARRIATVIAKAILISGGAAAAGWAQFSLPLPDEAGAFERHVQAIGYAGVMLAFAGGIWVIFGERFAPDALERARVVSERAQEAIGLARTTEDLAASQKQALEAKLNEALADSEWARELYQLSALVTATIDQQIQKNTSVGFGDAALQTLLDATIRPINRLLRIEAHEYWTVSILRLAQPSENNSGRLIIAATARSNPKDASRPHRSWGPGEGVAGHALLTMRETIIEDVLDADRSGWLHIPELTEDDRENYISMAAIPIFSSERTVWGTVVATSDQPERFVIQDGGGAAGIEPLRLLARMVALWVVAAYTPPPPRGDPPRETAVHE